MKSKRENLVKKNGGRYPMNKMNTGLFAACLISGLLAGTSSHVFAAASNLPCEVRADFMMATTTGAVVSLTASDIGGTEWLTWIHSEPGVTYEFDADPSGSADGVSCNQNGDVNADIISEGDFMVNGATGFSGVIFLEDNRQRLDTDIHLCASLAQSPRTQNDGKAAYASPRTVTIPYTLPVLAGSAGTGLAKLQMDDIRCRYRGDGTNYVFFGMWRPWWGHDVPRRKGGCQQLPLARANC
jgi:hypothetical protein